jgi:hypothetical protein
MGAVGAAIGVTLIMNLIASGWIDSAERAQSAALQGRDQGLDKQITEIVDLETIRAHEGAPGIMRSCSVCPEVVHLFISWCAAARWRYLTSIKQSDKRLEFKGHALVERAFRLHAQHRCFGLDGQARARSGRDQEGLGARQ